MSGSIQRDLIKWLCVPLLVINMIGALTVYMIAWLPAQKALDQNLAEIAFDLRMYLRLSDEGIRLELPEDDMRLLRANIAGQIYYVIRHGTDTLIGDTDFPPLLVPAAVNQPFPYSGRLRGKQVRFVVMRTVVGTQSLLIGVAETLENRRQVQANIILTLLGLEATLLAISAAIVWFAVREGLFPLQSMRSALEARTSTELSPMEEDLPVELHPLAKAINDLLHRLKSDGEARQHFLANVAHQLRTPLAGLKAQASLLQEKYAGDPEIAHTVGLMSSTTDRMIRQTNQLLALARTEANNTEKRSFEAVRLDKLVEEAIQQIVFVADQKKIDIGFELAPACVSGDTLMLRDLIDNLVDNALRYSPVGASVTVRCREAGDRVEFFVEDTGPGIPEAEREAVFSRYRRLDVKVPGTGLGLAIVHEIVTLHDATVSIGSGAGGKGTTFTVSFPRFDPDASITAGEEVDAA
ncbi:sensor histidine kinase [Noviherbaspirillum denitrificans]|uniref:histidine kinase n=1 Tax=Noviherbaspirillum denitrificans TaxID=1968433 RepID=A0A254TLQ9_9BURK|nr:sensor histidine kinase [Noviherbaspirillum denitrificans]OWW22282.1 hypothetical protein AYR66_25070 [Noviherbaspirillum denitrificans]